MGSKNKIVYGDHTFTQAEIPSGNCYLVTSLLSDSLEINTIEFDVESQDRSLTSFTRNKPLIYYYDDEQIGIFYIQKVDRIGPTRYHMFATSAIGLLDEVTHRGGIYTGETVAEVVTDICGAVPFTIKSKYQAIKLYGWLPIATGRENLAQVLFSIGAAVKTDLDGVIRIEGLWDGVSNSVGQDKMFSGASVEYSSAVTTVNITEHQYIKSGEETKLFEGVTQSGDVITFDQPMYDVSATGFTVLEGNANYAKVSAGSGTLTGRKYTHNTREVSKPVVSAQVPNVVSVKDATLVSLTNSEAVANRLVNYYQHVEAIDAETVYNAERPGDCISIWHPYDKTTVLSCLKSVDISMSNRLRAQERSVVGFVPQQIEDEVILEHRVLLTGSGTWSVPDGTTYVRAVLIDGGEEGADGEDGTVGTVPSTGSDQKYNSNPKLAENAKVTASASAKLYGSVSAGSGGEAGAAGRGGRILMVDLTITSEKAISFRCGGEVAHGGESETIFGSYSSSKGTRSQSGYTDPVTGEVFATPGLKGLKGGDGGAPGSPGKDAGSALGGAGHNSFSKNGSDSRGGMINTDLAHYSVTATAQFGASGGGGAGSDGTNGSDPSSGGTITCTAGSSGATVRSYAVSGGKGGDGKSGQSAVAYGSGGDGGSGGGGAGACGTLSVNATSESYWSRYGGSTATSYGMTASVYAVATGPDAPRVGKGGAGGAGRAGCIILYYGVRKAKASGPVVTKDGRYLADAKGRRIIV